MRRSATKASAPAASALIVEVLTDNRNRAAANVRTLFGKNGGNMGDAGSVAFMFDRLGEISIRQRSAPRTRFMEAAIEAGAEDAESDAEGHVVRTAFEDSRLGDRGARSQPRPRQVHRHRLARQIRRAGGRPEAATLMKLIGALEDDDDVQTVWTNADISEEDMARLGGLSSRFP